MSGAVAVCEPLPVVVAAALDQTPPEQRWLIETLWASEAVGVIGGSPKSCKTWLGLEMAVSVATNTACMGQFRVQNSGTALVYLAEDAAPAVRERLEALCHHRGLDLARVDVRVITAPSLRLDHEHDLRRLFATVAAHRPAMLLLDPLVRLHRADENNAQEVAAILAALRALQRLHAVAIVLTHHTRKNQRSQQHGQALRGSGDLHAWVDSALYLTHEKDRLRLTIEHRSAPTPKPYALRLQGEPPHLVLLDKEEQQEPVSLEDRIVETLRRLGKPTRRTDLRGLLAVNNGRLGEALTRLERLGRIQRAPEGWQA